MANENHADFTPTIPDSHVTPERAPYVPVGSFKFWAQKVLPTVYDDSLSYYEVLTKLVWHINKMIEDMDNFNQTIDSTLEAYNETQNYVNNVKDTMVETYNELQGYVNHYFDNLDVQTEINNKLDQMATSGELTELLQPFIPNLITDWLNNNVEPVGSAVVVDKSLTIEGAAADAKETGYIKYNVNTLSEHNANLPNVIKYNLFDNGNIIGSTVYRNIDGELDDTLRSAAGYSIMTSPIRVLKGQTISLYAWSGAYSFACRRNTKQIVQNLTSQYSVYTPQEDVDVYLTVQNEYLNTAYAYITFVDGEFNTDKTLTKTNMIADAHSVGEKINLIDCAIICDRDEVPLTSDTYERMIQKPFRWYDALYVTVKNTDTNSGYFTVAIFKNEDPYSNAPMVVLNPQDSYTFVFYGYNEEPVTDPNEYNTPIFTVALKNRNNLSSVYSTYLHRKGTKTYHAKDCVLTSESNVYAPTSAVYDFARPAFIEMKNTTLSDLYFNVGLFRDDTLVLSSVNRIIKAGAMYTYEFLPTNVDEYLYVHNNVVPKGHYFTEYTWSLRIRKSGAGSINYSVYSFDDDEPVKKVDVDSNVIIVDKLGKHGAFRNINDAVAYAKSKFNVVNDAVTILIKNGKYVIEGEPSRNAVIDKGANKISIIGEDRDNTIIILNSTPTLNNKIIEHGGDSCVANLTLRNMYNNTGEEFNAQHNPYCLHNDNDIGLNATEKYVTVTKNCVFYNELYPPIGAGLRNLQHQVYENCVAIYNYRRSAPISTFTGACIMHPPSLANAGNCEVTFDNCLLIGKNGQPALWFAFGPSGSGTITFADIPIHLRRNIGYTDGSEIGALDYRYDVDYDSALNNIDKWNYSYYHS